MDITYLLHFIDKHRERIGSWRFDVYFTGTVIYFTDNDCELYDIYRFELPPDLAQDVVDAYREQGRILSSKCVNKYGIEPAENVMLGYARRRKLALLLEVSSAP